MPRYIVFTELTSAGCRTSLNDPAWCGGLSATVEEVAGKIVEQYAILGPHQFCTVVDVRDNDAAHFVKLAGRDGAGAKHTVVPAIDLALFERLLGQSTENTGPYKWQISLPARGSSGGCSERYAFTGPAKKYFQPFRIIGAEHWDDVEGPAIIIANHSSFMDGLAMYAAMPKRYQRTTAYPAAADRFFVKGRKELPQAGVVVHAHGQLVPAPARRRPQRARARRLADREGLVDRDLPGGRAHRARRSSPGSGWARRSSPSPTASPWYRCTSRAPRRSARRAPAR